MFRINYEQRLKQKKALLKIGKLGMILGFPLFIIGFLAQYYLLAAIGQFSLYFGGSLIVIFSKIGWSKHILIDFLFNQLSILITFIGLLIGFSNILYEIGPSYHLGVLLFIVGFIMAGLGVYFSSK